MKLQCGVPWVESHGSEAGTVAKALCSFDVLFYLAALAARVQFGKSFYPNVFVAQTCSMFDGLLWYMKFLQTFICWRGKVESDGQEISTIEWQELKNRLPSFFVHK